MQSTEINKTFDRLMESCPHNQPNHQCPFEAYRDLQRNGMDDVSAICSLGNKQLMVNYHKVCNKIRTRNIKEPVLKAV
ncbi:MAG: hypothetical protein ACOC1J_01780 [Prolixibacteraceae bacterium]